MPRVIGAATGPVGFLVLVLAGQAAAAGDFPRPTKGGVEALMTLIDRCVAAGGLRPAKAPGSGNPYYVVADPDRLAAAIKAERTRIDRPLIDALVGGWEVYDEHEEPFAIAMLRTIGREVGDPRAAAFGEFFEGQVAARRRDAAPSIAAFREAARCFNEAGDRGWQATALHEAGRTLRASSDLGGAIAAYREALAIRRGILGENDPLVATTLNNIGSAYAELGDLSRATEFLRGALTIREKVLPADDPALAWSAHNLGFVAFRAGRHAEAKELLNRALAIRRKHAAEAPDQLADTLNGLGVVHSELAELDQAEACLGEVLEIRRGLRPVDEVAVAEVLSNLSVVADRRGDLLRARELQRQALDLRKHRLPPRHPVLADSLNILGSIEHELGDDVTAISDLEQALAIRRQFYGPNHPDVARGLNNLGGVYKDQGDGPRALEFYQKALAIWRAAYQGPHADIAFCLDNIGALQGARGEWADALAKHREALTMLEAVFGPAHPEVAASLNGLGAACEAAGQADEALKYYRRALEVARQAGRRDGREVIVALNNLAMAEARTGQTLEARQLLDEALTLAQRLPGEVRRDLARTLGNQAILQQSAGNLEDADHALGLALDALRRPGAPANDAGPPTPLALELWFRRGRVRETSLGAAPSAERLQACAECYEAAATVLESLRGGVIASQEGKLEAGENVAELFARLVGIRRRLFQLRHDPGDLLAAFSAAERGSARVFLEALGRARAGSVGAVDRDQLDREAAQQVRLRRLDAQIEALEDQPAESRRPEAIGRLLEERTQVESGLRALVAGLEARFPAYAALKYPRPCSLEQARACLSPGEVALVYVLGSEASFLIVVSEQSDGDPTTAGLAIHELAPASEIAPLVSVLSAPETLKYGRGLKPLDDPGPTASKRGRDAAIAAYRILLGPAAAAIADKNLVIVPGGVLGYLPFPLLLEPAGAGAESENSYRYLVEKHRIRSAPSMTSLYIQIGLWDQQARQERTRGGPERPLWAIGDPIYEGSDDRLAKAVELSAEIRDTINTLQGGGGVPGPVLHRLPGSGQEVDRLTRLMGAEPGEFLVGPAALESAVKTASESGSLARYRYIHFATHGILGLGEGIQPALVLSLVGEPKGEDGFLHLDEITRLKLNADLVVLSACQTGKGRLLNAEGVSGMARAFLFAGSRGVVCSLWQVADRETVDLMVDLYTGLRAGLPAADALCQTQRRLIGQGWPPLYWAPFILMGK
jgi:CHAT domain-containing protein/tetratricopeptide (TPR) repeat protein